MHQWYILVLHINIGMDSSREVDDMCVSVKLPFCFWFFHRNFMFGVGNQKGNGNWEEYSQLRENKHLFHSQME